MHNEIISPALDALTKFSGGRIGSEQQHVAVREMLHYAERVPFAMRLAELAAYKNPRLAVNLAGIQLDGCIGIGAGWDKAGRAVEALHRFAGASWVEVGTSLVLDQPGNDSTPENPRQRFVAGKIALNSLGFNADGAVSNARNLEHYVGKNLKIGISIGKNKTTADNFTPAAHYFATKRLGRYADYIVLNVSSPNTPGLRELQEKGKLMENGQAVNQALEEEGLVIPVFLKVSEMPNPALSDAIQAVYDLMWAGIIGPNTTVEENIKAKYGLAGLPGGLSGDDPDYIDMAEKLMAFIYKETNGQMVTVGVGGVNQRSAWDRFTKGGVTAIQEVTNLRQDGITAPSKTSRALIERMDREGVKHISEIRGQEIR